MYRALFLMLVLIVGVHAADRSHPYLFFSKKDLPALRAKVKDPVIGQMFSRVCSRATDHPNPSTKILCAGIAYHITGEKRYAEAGINEMMRGLGGSWFGGGAAVYHCDLSTAKKTLPIAIGWDMFYYELSQAQRDKITRTIEQKVFAPYLEAHAKHNEAGGFFTDSRGRKTYWTQCYFNWNHWVNGDIGLMGLSMYDDHSDAKAVVESARASLKYTHAEHNQGATECGGWDEGTMYWGTAFNHSTSFYIALEQVLGKDDGYFDLPGIKMTTQYPLDFTGPDGKWIPFSDCNNRAVIDPGSQSYYLAKRFRRTIDMAYPENYVDNFHPLPYAVLYRPPGPKVPLPQKKKISWYKDIHWAVLKNGPTELAFKGGDLTSNHGQNDLNSMVVYVGDQMMLSDPGYGTRDTKSHNTLLLNNQGQERRSNGSNRAGGGYSNSVCEIEWCGETENGDAYLIGNASDCYSGIKVFRRHVIVTEKGVVIVMDEIAAQAASTMTLNWHTQAKMSSNDKGAALSSGSTQLQIAATADQTINVNGSGRTLRVENVNKSQTLRAVTVMAPNYNKNINFEVSYSGSAVHIECFGKDYVFKMGKGGYRYDAEAKAEKKVAKKERTKRVRKPRVSAKPKQQETSVSDEIKTAWQTRLHKALEEALSNKREPYMSFMNKEYKVTKITSAGTLMMQSGSQQISYPFKRLRDKDRASLSQGLAEKGGDEEHSLAVFYLRLSGDHKNADKIVTRLPKERREELESIFSADAAK